MAKSTIVPDETAGVGFNLGSDTVNTSVRAAQDDGGDTFDLTGVEENKGFELIPKGKYTAVVEDLSYGPSKSSGKNMITVTYAITDLEYANRKLYDYWVLQGDTKEFGLGKLKKFLLRVCPGTDISTFNVKAFADNGTAIGRDCVLAVKITTQKQGEYKGEKRNNVEDVFSPEGGFMGN